MAKQAKLTKDLIIDWATQSTITHNGKRGYPRPRATYRAARRNFALRRNRKRVA